MYLAKHATYLSVELAALSLNSAPERGHSPVFSAPLLQNCLQILKKNVGEKSNERKHDHRTIICGKLKSQDILKHWTAEEKYYTAQTCSRQHFDIGAFVIICHHLTNGNLCNAQVFKKQIILNRYEGGELQRHTATCWSEPVITRAPKAELATR